MSSLPTLPLVLLLGAVTPSGLPMWLRLVPRNRFYGFRTRQTLASDETWYEANALAGRDLVVGGFAGALSAGLCWGLGFRDELILIACLLIPTSLATLHTMVVWRRRSPKGSL